MKVELELTKEQVDELRELRGDKQLGEYMLVVVKAGISQKQREVEHARKAKQEREKGKATALKVAKLEAAGISFDQIVEAAAAKDGGKALQALLASKK